MKRTAIVLLGIGCASTTTPVATPTAVVSQPNEQPAVPSVPLEPAPPLPATPQGLPELEVPVDNPLTPEKVALGKKLFFDKRLSKDGSMACASCHLPEKGWTDGLALSTKVGGALNTRHSPTVYNVGYQAAWYWDGRATTLEAQVEAAWKGQMGADPAMIASQLANIPEYRSECERICGQPPRAVDIVQALASFVRTIRNGDSAWDRYENGDRSAVSESAVRGYKVFTEIARCSLCHAPPLYMDFAFHNIGIGSGEKAPDPGRAKVTGSADDTGAFKTPTLRSISRTAPYFHDGHEPTLEGAVRLALGGGKKNPHLDAKLKPAKLSAKQFDDLMAFLIALDGQESFEMPRVP